MQMSYASHAAAATTKQRRQDMSRIATPKGLVGRELTVTQVRDMDVSYGTHVLLELRTLCNCSGRRRTDRRHTTVLLQSAAVGAHGRGEGGRTGAQPDTAGLMYVLLSGGASVPAPLRGHLNSTEDLSLWSTSFGEPAGTTVAPCLVAGGGELHITRVPRTSKLEASTKESRYEFSRATG